MINKEENFKTIFSSVNSALVDDGHNKIEDIKIFEFEEREQKIENIRSCLEEDGFVVIRSALPFYLVNGLKESLEKNVVGEGNHIFSGMGKIDQNGHLQ